MGQLEGAKKNGFLGKKWSKFTLKAWTSHDNWPQSKKSHQYCIVWPHKPSTLEKGQINDVFPVLQKLTHITRYWTGTGRTSMAPRVHRYFNDLQHLLWQCDTVHVDWFQSILEWVKYGGPGQRSPGRKEQQLEVDLKRHSKSGLLANVRYHLWHQIR